MPPEQAPPIPGGHVGVDQVADLLEGLLPDADAATVAAHLDACAECTRLRDDVAAVPGLLAGVGPPVLPAEVAARLDAAIADASAERRQRHQRPATVTVLDDRRRRLVGRAFTGVAAAAALVVGVLVVGDVVDQGGSDDQSAGGSPAADGSSAPGGEQEDAPDITSSGPARLRSDDFGVGARRVLSRRAAGQPENLRDVPGGDATGWVDDACTRRDLRAARIGGAFGPPALLDGEPVTLVASGPARRSLVVAYSCRTGRPVEQQRAWVDLTG